MNIARSVRTDKLTCASLSCTPMIAYTGFVSQQWIAHRVVEKDHHYLSHLVGKPTICLGENKGADQLRSNCEADQRLCFRCSDSTVPLLRNFKLLALFCACTCRFVSDLFGNHIVGFPTRWLNFLE